LAGGGRGGGRRAAGVVEAMRVRSATRRKRAGSRARRTRAMGGGSGRPALAPMWSSICARQRPWRSATPCMGWRSSTAVSGASGGLEDGGAAGGRRRERRPATGGAPRPRQLRWAGDALANDGENGGRGNGGRQGRDKVRG
jgi:hypothetical protein